MTAPVGVNLPSVNKETVILAGMAIGLVVYLIYKAEKAAEKVADTVAAPITAVKDAVKATAKAGTDAAKAVGGAIADPKNIVYDGIVGGIGRKITGDDQFTLGGWIYDKLH